MLITAILFTLLFKDSSSALVCNEVGYCSGGDFVDFQTSFSADECLDLCKVNTNCSWFSYKDNDNTCLLTKNCPSQDPACQDISCIYGQGECPEAESTLFLVATGYDGLGDLSDVEVVDVESGTPMRCTNKPRNYPIAVRAPSVFKDGDNPVICGGMDRLSNYYSQCYKYDFINDTWNLQSYSTGLRAWAFSVEIGPGEWMIMGGSSDFGDNLDSTLIFRNGAFEPGPPMPYPMILFSGAMVNNTHLLIVATDSYLGSTFMLDLTTMTYSNVAYQILNEGTGQDQGHLTGAFFNASAGERQLANVGHDGIQVYSPTNDQWHELSFPSSMSYQLMDTMAVQLGWDDFLMIGGMTSFTSDDTFRFQDIIGIDIWRKNVLETSRSLHVTVPISKALFTCS